MARPRYHRRSGVVATALLAGVTALTALAGCTSPRAFDPQDPDIVAQRGAARVLAADRLGLIAGGHIAAASAALDSCAEGDPAGQPPTTPQYRCDYVSSSAIPVPDVTTAATMLAAALGRLGCADPDQLGTLLSRWPTVNPGEPVPGSRNFSAAVIPPQVHRCGGAEVWLRFTTPDDALLEVTLADAATTEDSLIVSSRPYRDADVAAIRASEDRVVVVATVVRTYHEQPR